MQKTRILIVEDETAIAKMIAMNLRVANYDAVIYEDGAEATKGLEQDHAYDLALLDVMVPGMDGFTLLPIVREYGIPVIFLTAKDDLASKIQGLKGGAEDYIVKPFEVLELLMLNPDKVYSRENLLKLVWGTDYPGDVRTVDVHIRRLREKIELSPSEPRYVHTKWGVGYYFNDKLSHGQNA